MSVGVSVTTPALPSRLDLLGEACASVAAQSVCPVAHVVCVDYDGLGPALTANRCVSAVGSEWFCPLSDDNLLLPRCLEVLLAHAEGADIVYSLPRVVGRRVGAGFEYNGPFDRDRLGRGNYIDINGALVRTELWRELGGADPDDEWDDWGFLLRAADADARFVRVPEVLWVYRFDVRPGHRNLSLGRGAA